MICQKLDELLSFMIGIPRGMGRERKKRRERERENLWKSRQEGRRIREASVLE